MSSQLYKFFESNEGGSISVNRVLSFSCSVIGLILCVLGFFGLGSNPEYAYTLIGIGMGASTVKSVSSQFTNTQGDCNERKDS